MKSLKQAIMCLIFSMVFPLQGTFTQVYAAEKKVNHAQLEQNVIIISRD